MEFDRKAKGEKHYLAKQQRKGSTHSRCSCGTPSRSRNYYGRIDKARGLRKKADRHFHHRRRAQQKVAISSGHSEMIPGTSSCQQKRKSGRLGKMYYLSNHKLNV